MGMLSRPPSCVIGIDVGGTNTDAVILQKDEVLAWHKTPTTYDVQSGVEQAIEGVMKRAEIPSSHVESVKIGTTWISLQLCEVWWRGMRDMWMVAFKVGLQCAPPRSS